MPIKHLPCIGVASHFVRRSCLSNSAHMFDCPHMRRAKVFFWLLTPLALTGCWRCGMSMWSRTLATLTHCRMFKSLDGHCCIGASRATLQLDLELCSSCRWIDSYCVALCTRHSHILPVQPFPSLSLFSPHIAVPASDSSVPLNAESLTHIR